MKRIISMLLAFLLLPCAALAVCDICGGDGVCDTCGGLGFQLVFSSDTGVFAPVACSQGCVNGDCPE